MAPTVPHVAILAKAAGVHARPSAFDANARAYAAIDTREGAAPTVPHVATEAKAASVDTRLSAFDANASACAVAAQHRRFGGPLCVGSRRALAICHG